jgi:aldose 1-epimerase
MSDSSRAGRELRAGDLRLAVRPDLGGCIAGLWHRGVPVLLSAEPNTLQASRPSASFPLVPYSNRLGHRRFQWQGQDHTTAPNFGDSPHSLHGVAWLRAWQVVSASVAELVLRYEHRPDAHWPFAFAVQQHFALSPGQLSVRLAMTNTSPQSQPAGLGWHPYFPKRAGSHLRAQVAQRWEVDETQLPTQPIAHTGIDDDIARLRLDHCFSGWQGAAELRDERFSLALRSSLGHLVVYTPHDKDYFCVEPVSHVNNAIQMPDPLQHGLVALNPGDTTDAWMTLDVTPL